MKKLTYLVIVLISALSFSGCSLKYDLNPPLNSSAAYDQGGKEQRVVYVVDNRVDKEFTKGLTGLQNVKISIGNVDDPVAWLASSLEEEFKSHEIHVQVTSDAEMQDSADAILTINRYEIISARSTGFHPYVAYHLLAGNISTQDSSEPVKSYFAFGKVPVWSMDEIQGPCFDMPAAILIKGLAAKVNRYALHYRMSDAQLSELHEHAVEEVNGLTEDAYLHENSYLAVLELGQSNNGGAEVYLKAFAEHDDVLIRACALSALGMICDERILEYLQEKYKQHNDIDRFMALKSIGDIGTPAALEFLKEARKDPQYTNDFGMQFVVDLYLEPGR